jgi:ribosome recycling factor
MNNLTQYLNEIKAELQELYEDLDAEIKATDNDTLMEDGYYNVTSKLESALTELDVLIADVDSGIYDKEPYAFEDDELLEDEEDF